MFWLMMMVVMRETEAERPNSQQQVDVKASYNSSMFPMQELDDEKEEGRRSKGVGEE